MTDTSRIVFREARVKPPPEFHEILRMRRNFTIRSGTVEGRRIITVSPTHHNRIEDSIRSKYNLGHDALASLEYLSRLPFVFKADPAVDPVERLLTPGAGPDFVMELQKEAKVNDPKERLSQRMILENAILPSHEADDHIQMMLNPEKSCRDVSEFYGSILLCMYIGKHRHLVNGRYYIYR